MPETFFESTRVAIESHFKTQWDTTGGGVLVEWDNVAFTAPDGGSWVRLTIGFSEAEQASIGSSALERVTGLVFVQCFTAKGVGAAPGLALADLVANAFRWHCLTSGSVSVTMRSPALKRAGDRPDFAQWNVQIPFDARQVTIRP